MFAKIKNKIQQWRRQHRVYQFRHNPPNVMMPIWLAHFPSYRHASQIVLVLLNSKCIYVLFNGVHAFHECSRMLVDKYVLWDLSVQCSLTRCHDVWRVSHVRLIDGDWMMAYCWWSLYEIKVLIRIHFQVTFGMNFIKLYINILTFQSNSSYMLIKHHHFLAQPWFNYSISCKKYNCHFKIHL